MIILKRMAVVALMTAGAAGLSGCLSAALLAASAANDLSKQTTQPGAAGRQCVEVAAVACDPASPYPGPIVDISNQPSIQAAPDAFTSCDIWPRGKFQCLPGPEVIRKGGYRRDVSNGWRVMDRPRLYAAGFCDLDNRGRTRGADLHKDKYYPVVPGWKVGWRGRDVSPSWFYGNGWRRDTNNRWARSPNMDWYRNTGAPWRGPANTSWRRSDFSENTNVSYRSPEWGRNRFRDFDRDRIRDYDPATYDVRQWGGTYRVR